MEPATPQVELPVAVPSVAPVVVAPTPVMPTPEPPAPPPVNAAAAVVQPPPPPPLPVVAPEPIAADVAPTKPLPPDDDELPPDEAELLARKPKSKILTMERVESMRGLRASRFEVMRARQSLDAGL